MKYLRKFENNAAYESATLDLPNVAYCKEENEVHYNPWTWANEYLTFVALEDGTFTFEPRGNNVISYSTDNGITWTEENSVEVSNGDKVLWKGEMVPVEWHGIGTFSSTSNFNVEGNAMSLLFSDNFKGHIYLSEEGNVFQKLFCYNTKVINAENLSLPAITLTEDCYQAMFLECTNLITAPKLPAETLADSCYLSMFGGCTNLISAPELPATTLASDCYSFMFGGCNTLTTAPELPAKTLVSNCYNYMFQDCTNLNYIKAMFITTPDTNYTKNWVDNVSATGTFIKNSDAVWTITGVNGIPTGWTVETASK